MRAGRPSGKSYRMRCAGHGASSAALFRRALRAGVSQRTEDIEDLCDGFVGRNVVRMILASDLDRAMASVWVRPIPRPVVLLAFVDSAGFLEDMDGPASLASNSRSLLGRRQHRNHSTRTNPSARLIVPCG